MPPDVKDKDPGVKEKIIKSARVLFSEKGYHGTSVQDIARNAGVNKAMLFYYFNSKKNLYQSIMMDAMKSMKKRIQGEIASANGCMERLRKSVRAYVYSFAEGRQIARMFIYSFLGLGPSFPVPLDKLFYERQRPLLSILEEGVEKGIFREMDCRFMAQAIVGSILVFFEVADYEHEKYTEDKIIENILDLIENGLLAGRVSDEEVV